MEIIKDWQKLLQLSTIKDYFPALALAPITDHDYCFCGNIRATTSTLQHLLQPDPFHKLIWLDEIHMFHHSLKLWIRNKTMLLYLIKHHCIDLIWNWVKHNNFDTVFRTKWRHRPAVQQLTCRQRRGFLKSPNKEMRDITRNYS